MGGGVQNAHAPSGHTTLPAHPSVHQLQSSLNLIVQDFYGSLITWACLIKSLAISD